MATRVLRNSAGKEVGRISEVNGVHILRSPSGKELGRFDPKADITKDAVGKIIGRGNLLAYLVGLTV